MSIITCSSQLFTWVKRVWRYQRVNQNSYIEGVQTTQWPNEKVQKNKQRSTKHTYKTKNRVTRTPLKTGGELRCSGRVSSSWFASGTRRVNLVSKWWSISEAKNKSNDNKHYKWSLDITSYRKLSPVNYLLKVWIFLEL